MSRSISIFTVNYNTCSLLEKCLVSLFKSHGELKMEVFVADNNSTDSSREMIKEKYPKVSLAAHNCNWGYTKAINPLLKQAKGDYFLILHPDVELLEDTLLKLLNFFDNNPKAGILGGNLYYPDGTANPCEIKFPNFQNELLWFGASLLRRIPGHRTYEKDFNPSEWSHHRTQQVNWVWNACMMIRRQVIEQIGYFDENFFVWFADWDLCKRATDAGWECYYVKEATAVHHERQSFSGEKISMEEIRYKVDGWHSAPGQMRDKNVFLRKYLSPAGRGALKAVYTIENILRLIMLLINSHQYRSTGQDIKFPAKACLQTIRAILKP